MDYDFSCLMPKGVQAVVVPLDCLGDIKENIREVSDTKQLNNFQKFIMSKYVLDIPEIDFAPKSIIIAAAPFVIRDVVFEYKDMTFVTMTACEENGYWDELEKNVKKAGFNIASCQWLPRKLLASRTGLVQYGRNNITFAKELGSFYGLMAYFSDIPAPEAYEWNDFGYMDFCDNCLKCIRNCPTGAFNEESFMLNTDRCLSAMLSSGNYIDDNARRSVHALDGCYRCQDICPFNQKVLSKEREKIVFSNDDTKNILAGNITEDIRNRMNSAGVSGWACDLAPKTLTTVFENIKEEQNEDRCVQQGDKS